MPAVLPYVTVGASLEQGFLVRVAAAKPPHVRFETARQGFSLQFGERQRRVRRGVLGHEKSVRRRPRAKCTTMEQRQARGINDLKGVAQELAVAQLAGVQGKHVQRTVRREYQPTDV
jgi:hypothetical protein